VSGGLHEYDGMTVNERLFAAGLLESLQLAEAAGDAGRISEILAKVGLWRDASGMHRSLSNGNIDAQD
jgi:ABC-type multidrug transport system ATPase subunit